MKERKTGGKQYRKDILLRESEIREWINEHQSKAFICKQLCCRPGTLDTYLKKLGIEYSGNRGAKGIKCGHGYISVTKYLNTESVLNSHKIKLKLLRENIKKHQCERCKNTEWENKEIPLELHHIDGNRFNNQFNNLLLLCPNCHALEENNSGAKNKKKK